METTYKITRRKERSFNMNNSNSLSLWPSHSKIHAIRKIQRIIVE